MNNYPKYKCHKVVNGFKILRIASGELSPADGSAKVFNLWPVDHDLDPVEVSPAWIAKHQPREGGYYVLYEDGYASFSPAKAFEEGYALEVNAKKPKFDVAMHRVGLGLIYAAIGLGVGLMVTNLVDKFSGAGTWSFVDEKTGASCIVLDDGGRVVMNCLPAAPKAVTPETTQTTVIIEGDDMMFPESRT